MNAQGQTVGNKEKQLFTGDAETIFRSLGLSGDVIKAVTPYWEYLSTLGNDPIIAVARSNYITSVLMSYFKVFDSINH